MTPSELKDVFRQEIDDTKTPYLWPDATVFRYMNTAYNDFCRRTDYLSDATTADTCTATVVANEKFVDLSPLVLKIRQAKLTSTGRYIAIKTLRDMDGGWAVNDYGSAVVANWQTTTGTPQVIITDIELNKGRLYPIPTAADTIELMVYRLPIDSVDANSSEFEIADEDHQQVFLLKMKSLAYGKHDSDLYNPELEARYKKAFEDVCTDIKWELSRKRDKSWTTRSAYR